uniref:RNA-binding protein 41 n=1 Tax=Amphiprion percula TaxID=161767 RepID=A0A3P8RR76_AMPPE
SVRVSRRPCEDGPLLEEQETEGQRQLHSLLLQQLHTDIDIDRCVAKRQCFAPAALYRPFGEQAAGVRSLSQFQALQDGEKELAGLRELGLTDTEIQLWQSRDVPEATEKVRPPEDRTQQRLQVIRDKMEARAELLSRPQRFAASRPLSRREMEIEQALFQGNDRPGFLTALYHRGMEDVLRSEKRASLQNSEGESPAASHLNTHRTASNQSQDSQKDGDQSKDDSDHQSEPRDGRSSSSGQCGSETLTDEEILKNRQSEEEIRNIPRFRNYQPGKPSKVVCVKNLSAQASVAQLVALFSRFERQNSPPVVYRLLTGRMKGQAFITLPDAETAQNALQLVHGYRLLGKPLVVEFGREREEEEKQKEKEAHVEEK